jgi:acyl-CoA synthetase (AMP-forming)/AMP-acid ligase II
VVGWDGRRFGYAQMCDRTLAMAEFLWRQGLHSGAAIGVLACNPPESLFLQLAAHLLGCRTAWIANNAPAPFRRSFLKQAGVDAFVYEMAHFTEIGAELAKDLDVPIYCFGPGGLGADLAALPSVSELSFDSSACAGEPQSLFQTGGTTGDPKLVWHRHGYFQEVLALSRDYLASGAPQLRHLLVAGTWHVSSQLAAFITLFTGGTLFLQVGVDNAALLRLIETERVNSTLLAPGFLYALLDDPRLADADCSSLRTLTVSGSNAAPARLAQAIERFGPILRVTYGMSEAPFITALPNMTAEPAYRLASCGQPYARTRVQVRTAAGVAAAPDEVGEVWVTGPLQMAGYWAAPDLTDETLVDGWLRTGDLGRLDADGYLYLVDRAKDMIVTGMGSTNVYCRPVEDILQSHPLVRAAAVIGVPHETMGEAVHAVVVPVEGSSPGEAELCQLVREQLNQTWAPRSVEFRTQLPLTASGKVDKKVLREQYQARHRTGHPAAASATGK